MRFDASQSWKSCRPKASSKQLIFGSNRFRAITSSTFASRRWLRQKGIHRKKNPEKQPDKRNHGRPYVPSADMRTLSNDVTDPPCKIHCIHHNEKSENQQ